MRGLRGVHSYLGFRLLSAGTAEAPMLLPPSQRRRERCAKMHQHHHVWRLQIRSMPWIQSHLQWWPNCRNDGRADNVQDDRPVSGGQRGRSNSHFSFSFPMLALLFRSGVEAGAAGPLSLPESWTHSRGTYPCGWHLRVGLSVLVVWSSFGGLCNIFGCTARILSITFLLLLWWACLCYSRSICRYLTGFRGRQEN